MQMRVKIVWVSSFAKSGSRLIGLNSLPCNRKSRAVNSRAAKTTSPYDETSHQAILSCPQNLHLASSVADKSCSAVRDSSDEGTSKKTRLGCSRTLFLVEYFYLHKLMVR